MCYNTDRKEVNTLKDKLKAVIRLLHEIDDELGNEMCLVAPDEEEPLTEFTFWGVASMVENYLAEIEKRG